MYGVDRQYPAGENQTNSSDVCYDGRLLGYGGICPYGHYCPGGVASTYPISCDNGTYADEEGLATCKSCPQGNVIVNVCTRSSGKISPCDSSPKHLWVSLF